MRVRFFLAAISISLSLVAGPSTSFANNDRSVSGIQVGQKYQADTFREMHCREVQNLLPLTNPTQHIWFFDKFVEQAREVAEKGHLNQQNDVTVRIFRCSSSFFVVGLDAAQIITGVLTGFCSISEREAENAISTKLGVDPFRFGEAKTFITVDLIRAVRDAPALDRDMMAWIGKKESGCRLDGQPISFLYVLGLTSVRAYRDLAAERYRRDERMLQLQKVPRL